MATDRQQRLQETLDAVVAQAGVLGALLVTRDGFCMMNRVAKVPAAETLSAMTATMLGAAEAALAEVGGEGTPRVTLETKARRMVVVTATDELLLVGISDTSVRAEDLAARLEAAAQTVAKLVSG